MNSTWGKSQGLPGSMLSSGITVSPPWPMPHSLSKSKDLNMEHRHAVIMHGISNVFLYQRSPPRRDRHLNCDAVQSTAFLWSRLGLTYLQKRSVMHRVREIEPLQPRFFNTPLSSFISSCYYLVTNNLLLFSNMLLTIAEKEGLYPQKIVNNPITRDHAS